MLTALNVSTLKSGPSTRIVMSYISDLHKTVPIESHSQLDVLDLLQIKSFAKPKDFGTFRETFAKDPDIFNTSSKVPGLRPGQTDITKEM